MGKIYEVLSRFILQEGPDHFARRLVIELCENIHIHYRNLRLEFSKKEFFQLCNCMADALANLQKYLFKDAKEISMEEIEPFDGAHKPLKDYFDCGKEQEEHEKGIKFVKLLILNNEKILPIAVYFDKRINKYKRLDGFKRYWAFKKLGYKTIRCYTLDSKLIGCQRGMGILEEKKREK